MHYLLAAPEAWLQIPEEERKSRGEISSDQCTVDGHFFVLGNLELPVIDSTEKFSWDVWVSLSEQNFARMSELWNQSGRETEPPYFGWLSSSIPTYPSTLLLKTHVHTRRLGMRPLIELEPTDHPLAVEQSEGITMARVREIAEFVFHR